MSRSKDDPTSTPGDARTGAPESAGETSAQGTDDLAREGAATAVEKMMEIADTVGDTTFPSGAPAKMTFKDHVSALREMGREQFIQRSHEVARRIVTLIQAAAEGPLPEDVRPMNASDTRARELYMDSVHLLRDAEIADSTDNDAIVFDLSFDPVNPVSLTINRGSRVVYAGIHWALWKTIEKSLSPEDKEFMRIADLKANVEKRIDEYERGRKYLQAAGIDLDKPQLFDEA